MKNMGDYHDHYLKKDVLLLTCIFEKFIKTCLEFYGLDPCHYISSPGVSWDAMLKMTGIELKKYQSLTSVISSKKDYKEELLTLLKDMPKQIINNDYDPKKPSTFIAYLDKNNLYDWTMCEYLPYARFK